MSDFSQPHRTEHHLKLLEAQSKSLHEWWNTKLEPLDAETTAKIIEELNEAWRACK